MSNGRNPANKQEMPLPYHILRFIPPRETPACLAKLLNTFMKRVAGFFLPQPLNSSSKFRQTGFQLWF
jgi:hypothetical protein